ncbi:hypothetical protein Tco_1518025 [Tanacetum coccineum]
MLLVAKEELGEALTANENDFFVNTNDEGEQLEANVVFMARLEKVDAFEAEHCDVLNDIPTCKSSRKRRHRKPKKPKHWSPKGRILKLSKVFPSTCLRTEAYCLEYNGVIERRNPTLIEAARIMLTSSKLSIFLWVEAFVTRFLALGWLLEEIHVTLAHLEKKRTRLRTYIKSLEELCKQ